ncbi:ProQ activator of osmoprotectant transporter prop, partial [Pseudomonas syringae pv. actinidifoliorum]|nr:ProQ activator of osmoprotectant transporter prop [Pseudomonas syringae pv. actinidifoliorum]
YWASMVENAARLDLNGQAVGTVTATQAAYAKQQASRQRGQVRGNGGKQKTRATASVADAAMEATAD